MSILEPTLFICRGVTVLIVHITKIDTSKPSKNKQGPLALLLLTKKQLKQAPTSMLISVAYEHHMRAGCAFRYAGWSRRRGSRRS